VLEDYSKVIGK